MKIVVFGMGYVGLTAAACALKQGHSVCGVDVNRAKVNDLLNGNSPIFEPGLSELLSEGKSSGAFTAAFEIGDELADADLAVVCVGTPSLPDGSHNMSYIASVSREVARALKTTRRVAHRPLVISYRSTVRPGTMEELIEPIFESELEGDVTSYELVYNPEFLRESTAIKDYFDPPKIVLGTVDGEPNPVIDELYSTIKAPRFHVKFREAEITKFVDNSFHAVKVTFANEIGRVCHRLGISATKVHEIFVSDRKLNISPYYTRPGGAFGGSCLPKDVRALAHISTEVGANTQLIDSLLQSNANHRRFLFEEATRDLSRGAKILLNGLAFKANSDDLRESPLVDIAEMVRRAGFELIIHDPNVDPKTLVGANLGYQLAHLPTLGSLMVPTKKLKGAHFDLIMDARGDLGGTGVTADRQYDLSTMA
jgi:GDP-mannose 6-dehydrogenase